MRAIEYTEYGPPDVLRLVEVAKPAPKDDEVLIRIRAASINALDWRMVAGRPLFARLFTGGLRRPKVTRLGVDVSGEVEAIGASVTRFKPGAMVFGACRGSFDEYACAPEAKLASNPSGAP
ncbi:MAG TPA: alcohol dehydrogenase catalytic domain-containing protein, partial [Blastocatellia bacterium]|nr:alcohol dehydrogenase catalytic domain-containing protein [Blastocatellia bacterium]